MDGVAACGFGCKLRPAVVISSTPSDSFLPSRLPALQDEFTISCLLYLSGLNPMITTACTAGLEPDAWRSSVVGPRKNTNSPIPKMRNLQDTSCAGPRTLLRTESGFA